MPDITRRRALTAAAAVAVTASAVALTSEAASAAGHAGHSAPDDFNEVYKGRRIQGRPASGDGHPHGHGHGHGGGYEVFVDGVQLHLMQNADGSWISVISHYDPVATPRAAARAAVDELQGARLLPFPAN